MLPRGRSISGTMNVVGGLSTLREPATLLLLDRGSDRGFNRKADRLTFLYLENLHIRRFQGTQQI